MKVVIAEDEPLARSLLRSLLIDAGDIEVIGEARDASETLALTSRLQPDAVFLDINMPGGSGIGVAHELQSRSSAEIVFVTAHEVHAVDAFELGAVDYLLKPVRRPRLSKALDRVRAKVREKKGKAIPEAAGHPAYTGEQFFWVPSRKGTLRVPVSDIIWVEAARDHVYLHTAGQSYLYRSTMDELEGRLERSGMIRVHRSALVRLKHVTAILRQGRTISLELFNSARVTVGPRYQAGALAALARGGPEQTG